MFSEVLYFCWFFCSDRTLKVWSVDGLSDDVVEASNLKAKAVVAAHDKDINSLAVAPNDRLVCSGSQVGNLRSTEHFNFIIILNFANFGLFWNKERAKQG